MDSVQALHNFWSSFGWKAYDENTVPSEEQNPTIPRITYQVIQSELDNPVTLTASLWDRGYSWENVDTKAQEIYDYIGLGGVLVHFDGGAIWIKRAILFSQRMSDENDTIRRVVLQIDVEFLRG